MLDRGSVGGASVGMVDDLAAVGAPVENAERTARWIDHLALTGPQKARLLRSYLIESRKALSAAVLVAARNYSFHL